MLTELMEEDVARPELRAPQQSGETLVVPPWRHLPAVVRANCCQRSGYECEVQGRTLASLGDGARQGLVNAARDYTSQYRDVPPSRSGSSPVLLAGHQPQLFHPGVWFKNFALGRLASQVGGVGVNLLIDSDVVRSVSIRVPVGDATSAQAVAVAYDRTGPSIPFEEKAILEQELFTSFGVRATEQIRPLVAEPLLETFWPIVCEVSRSQQNLGRCLAGARHRLEGMWGNETFELPASAVCRLPEFRWFVAHLLAHLPRFADVHNAALAEYRVAHRLRGGAHPAPNLVEEDGWLEAPFWVWSADAPRRRRLFARCRGETVELTDRRGWRAGLPLSAERDAAGAVDELAALDARGIRIRSRALVTTLFARLVLCDLFIHGIGGAKYDQVTDDLARRFFGLELPKYATISATLRLLVEGLADRPDEEPRLRHAIRELRYHPERYLPPLERLSPQERPHVERLIEEKLGWIATLKTPANANERHRGIVAANADLQPFVADARETLHARHAQVIARLRASAILGSREYAFCLHSSESLSRLLVESFCLCDSATG